MWYLIAGTIFAVSAAYLLVIRPWHLRWGKTGEEVKITARSPFNDDLELIRI